MTDGAPPPEPESIRVLLVDDIEENLIALEALIRRHNVAISTARSGREALELLLEHDYALALLDVNMPEMDGFQLAELMRGTQRTRNVPIIFVTAAYDPHRVFQGYEAGAVDFLIKPVDPRVLRSKVSTFLALHEQKRQLAQQVAEIEGVRDQLAQSLRLQETFVAAVGHDLRTPLQAIDLGLALLSDELESPSQRDVLKRVSTSVRRMSTMLDELHDLARLRLGGGLELSRQRIDLGTVVREVVSEAELKKQAPIDVEQIGDVAGSWDAARITRIVQNLIANAQHHGVGGRIAVRLDGTDPAVVVLAVSNPGEIPHDVRPHVFEPFRRGPSSRNGLGLGLYIVRELARAHGGSVDLTSITPGVTRVEVHLPRT
jgi:signal transduction histidine kinase